MVCPNAAPLSERHPPWLNSSIASADSPRADRGPSSSAGSPRSRSPCGVFLAFGGTLTSSMSIPGTETERVNEQLNEELAGLGGATGTVVFQTEDGSALTDEQQEEISALLADIGEIDGVSDVVDPFAAASDRADQEQQLADGAAQIEAARRSSTTARRSSTPAQQQLDAGTGPARRRHRAGPGRRRLRPGRSPVRRAAGAARRGRRGTRRSAGPARRRRRGARDADAAARGRPAADRRRGRDPHRLGRREHRDRSGHVRGRPVRSARAS